MVSGNKDEKRGMFSIFGGSSAEGKSCWWLPFVFLFLFLAAGGFYAWYAMKGAAHKLVGGGSYNQLSANSAGYTGGSSIKKEDNFFASEEDLSSPAGIKTEASGLAAFLAQAGSEDQGSAAPGGGANPAEEPSNPGGASAYRASGSLSNTLQSKLQARESALAGVKGGQTSKSTGFNYDGGREKPSVAPVDSTEKKPDGQAPKKGPGASVMESLTSVFKSSLYATRLTSQDAASAWIAKNFSDTPDAGTALQYTDKMRSALDKINPRSIPNYLRDQELSAAGAKTLGVSAVGKLEAEKVALEGGEDSQSKNAVLDMAGAMINPMFGGVAGVGGQAPSYGGGMSNPKAPPGLGNTLPPANGYYTDQSGNEYRNGIPFGQCVHFCTAVSCSLALVCNN